MTQQELKKKLYDLVSTYFSGAGVSWSMTKKANPNSPMVALTMGTIYRHYLPTRGDVNGVPIDCYQCYTTLQVDLFTMGADRAGGESVTAERENTAVNDMADFVNFLNSVYVDHWCLLNDVSIQADRIHDVTQLANDSSWDFRAMVELAIGFTQNAVGYSATMYEGGVKYDESGNPIPTPPEQPPPPVESTPSGGRSQELGDQYTGWFEQVETEQVKEDLANGK